MKTFKQWLSNAGKSFYSLDDETAYLEYATGEMLKTMREERRVRDNFVEKTFREQAERMNKIERDTLNRAYHLEERIADIDADLDTNDTNFVALEKRVAALDGAEARRLAALEKAINPPRVAVGDRTYNIRTYSTVGGFATSGASVEVVDHKARIAAGMSQAGRDAARKAFERELVDYCYQDVIATAAWWTKCPAAVTLPSWYNTPRRSWFSLDDGGTIKADIARGMSKAGREAWFSPVDASRAKDVWAERRAGRIGLT